jgi:hypothetical protein
MVGWSSNEPKCKRKAGSPALAIKLSLPASAWAASANDPELMTTTREAWNA